MEIEKRLNRIKLPPEYTRNGVNCFLDPYRKRLIEITPEEIVRQKVAAYFEKEIGVPYDMLSLEVPMSRYLAGTKGRADIIVHAPVDAEMMRAVAVIECKNTDIQLTDQVLNQAQKYADVTLADYFFVTNGIEIYSFKFDEGSRTYIQLSEIPPYKMMIEGHGQMMQTAEEKFCRLSVQELSDIKLLDEYNNAGEWIYGSRTPDAYKPSIINLYQGLMDTDTKLPKMKNPFFTLVEDLGVRVLDYSNGGGGHFFGNYRSFLIEDSNGDSQIYSISLFGTASDFRATKGEHRNSYSVLFVAVDRFKTSKPVLQLNLDTFFRRHDNGLSVIHDGRISGLPSNGLRDYIQEKSPELMNKDGMIELGFLPANRLITMQEDYRFIYRVLQYSVLRDDFRKKTQT